MKKVRDVSHKKMALQAKGKLIYFRKISPFQFVQVVAYPLDVI